MTEALPEIHLAFGGFAFAGLFTEIYSGAADLEGFGFELKSSKSWQIVRAEELSKSIVNLSHRAKSKCSRSDLSLS